MYVKSDEDFKKVFEVVKDHREKTHVQKRWIFIAAELNDFFKTGLSPRQWKSQYDTAIKRIKKYGSPGIKLARTEEKEIPNLKNGLNKKLIEQESIILNVSDQKQKLRNFITKPKSMEDITKFLEVDEIQIYGLIHSLKLDGHIVQHNEYDNLYFIDKKPYSETKVYNHSIGDKTEFEFVVISCSHWGSKKQQKSFTEFIYDEAHKRRYC